MTDNAMPDSGMSPLEQRARQELAACYRFFALQGWNEGIYNHITVKVPGQPDAFLINPFGLLYSEVKASNLIKVGCDGRRLDTSTYPINPAGFLQHSLFHRSLPDAHAIIHTHTTATMAVCSLEGGLQPTNFFACGIVGELAYHDFEGVTVREDECGRLLRDLGDKRILMLRNHGPVVIASSLPAAFAQYWTLQRACEVQVATMSMGRPVRVPEGVVEVHQRDLARAQASAEAGRAEFDAMMRLVERIDPSFRD